MTSRITFFDEACLLSEIPMLGWSKQNSASQYSLPSHKHENAYEIVLVKSGQLRWWVEEEQFSLGAGRLFLTRPGEWHGAVLEKLEPSEIFWVQLRLNVRGAFGLERHERDAFCSDLGRTGRLAKSSQAIENHFETLLNEHQSGKNRVWLVRAHALCLLDAARIALTKGVETAPDERVQRAKALISRDLSVTVPVAEIAAHLGISDSWLKQMFLRETGFTLADWLQQERIRHAQRLLVETDASVTDIAFDVGFSSSQYFATVFKAAVGMTPKEFRNGWSPTRVQMSKLEIVS